MLEIVRVVQDLNRLVASVGPEELRPVLPALAATLAHVTARLAEVERPAEAAAVKQQPSTAEPRTSSCLRMREAAKVSGLQESTLREAGRRGELPLVHVGRYVYVRPETLSRWIAERESKSDGTR